jgi:hypothetical protein
MGGHGSHELNTATRGCKGNGQSELARAIPTTSFRVVAKNPSQQHLLAAQLFLCLNYSSFYILN